jgi:riboflavin biosynthesis pyrimidine reductase
MTIRRILPTPATATTIREAYDVVRNPLSDRPWVGVCMVASLDGSVVADGGSGALGNSNDVEVLSTLRSIADLIIVGAGTVRAEDYGPPKKPGQRIGVVTNSGSLDLASELFSSGAGFLIAPEQATIDESRVDVLRAGTDDVDLAGALGRLDEVAADVRYVQAEGGGVLNGALYDHDLVDELDLTISPRLVGGDGPRLVRGAAEVVRDYALAQLLADDDGFLFGRWIRNGRG